MKFIHGFLQKWLLAIPVLTTLTTWYCFYTDFTFELRALVTIFFAGVFFAFAITMNTANVRRFQALDDIALLKSILLSLSQTAKNYLKKEQLVTLNEELRGFFTTLQNFLCEDSGTDASNEKLLKVDLFFEKIIATTQDLRVAGMPAPEISRVLQWHQQAYFAFEKLLTVKERRTPLALRLFMTLALIVALFVLAPQFALFGYYGVLSAAIVSIVMVVLIWIQNMLEHPFGEDADDILFDFSKRMANRVSD